MKHVDRLKINRILIANRGEIALRVIRTVKEMGITAIAVFSEVDRNAPHVLMADEAVCIGPANSSESYLNTEKILGVARVLKIDAIHPGYGFLSENAEFAKSVEKSGIHFIGPSSKSIKQMGDKIQSKKAVSKYNVPVVSGNIQLVENIKVAKVISKEIGYPVLIKASAGGGGKGMRIVESEDELEEKLNLAMSESTSAFGSPTVFLEKFLKNPRHIEFQIVADKHGNIVHLFERECSIQRRHQKIIEEAPSSIMTPELREEMGRCAVNVARSCDYSGVGTVEFLVDEEKQFYFLEMNTRLQVEHPVTEMITDLDLVKEQIKIAEGDVLSFKQEDLHIKGHAIEIRVYAEDADDNFMPNTGLITEHIPPGGPGVRLDSGYASGMEVGIYYDPLISKLIVHNTDRQSCIARMIRAIDEYKIGGLRTTLGFCRLVLQHPDFISGDINTQTIEKYFVKGKVTENSIEKGLAAMITALEAREASQVLSTEQNTIDTSQLSGWRKRRGGHG